ncbi:MAG: YihY/virulence factor BrkB family protein [Burkholderiales bacterium]|nr:YihY/virulence factor BrkB family protein [Burkholderiales bacterium]
MLNKKPARYKSAVYAAIWSGHLDTMADWKAGAIRLLRMVLVLVRDLAYGQLTLRATGLVFTTLLSLVPLLALSFSVLKAFGVYNQIDPILLKFLAPLGEKSVDVSKWLIKFIENLNVKVLGSIGLALLIYTVVSLMEKIEESVNFIWHVAQLRSFARRFSGYLSVLLIGPVLLFSIIGITATIMATPQAERLLATEPIGGIAYALGQAIPVFFVIALFVFAYRFAPNTSVKLNAALTGGIVAGLLWQAASWAFAEFARTSTQYAAIYSSFAIFLLFLIWLYLNWLILLLGASIAFYSQHPEYLVLEQGEPRLSNRMRERVALMLMYLIGKSYRDGNPAQTFADLTQQLGVPTYALQRVIGSLEQGGLLLQTGDDPPAYLPSRDLGSILLKDLLHAVRTAGEEQYLEPQAVPAPAEIESILARMNLAFEDGLRDLTVRDLMTPAASAAADR